MRPIDPDRGPVDVRAASGADQLRPTPRPTVAAEKVPASIHLTGTFALPPDRRNRRRPQNAPPPGRGRPPAPGTIVTTRRSRLRAAAEARSAESSSLGDSDQNRRRPGTGSMT